MTLFEDDWNQEYDDLAQRVRYQNKFNKQLLKHTDPRDPDCPLQGDDNECNNTTEEDE